MAGWSILTTVVLAGVSLAATACEGSDPPRLYTAAATKACLNRLPDAIAGLPPATPPRPPALFVYSFPRDRWFPPRVHGKLGAWRGHKGRGYEGMTLSFFKTARAARASRKQLVWLYGGRLIRNVVVAREGARPRKELRTTVLNCLRTGSGAAATAPQRPTPPASLATFAGYWGGHTRGLRISSGGRGVEYANSGCCFRIYDLTFQIRSVSGTLTRATAEFRVTSFKKGEFDTPRLREGQVGKLVLRNGIVTNVLTEDYFCSNPAWGATGACGA